MSAAFAVYALFNDQHVGHFRIPVVPMLIIAMIFLLLGIGVRRCSRAAAVAAGLLFLLQQGLSSSGIVIWFDSILPQVVILVGAFALFFASGIRGAFVYQRLNRLQSRVTDETS